MPDCSALLSSGFGLHNPAHLLGQRIGRGFYGSQSAAALSVVLSVPAAPLVPA